MRIRIYAKDVPKQAQEGQSISRRASIVAKSCLFLKVATFQSVRTERNKRLFNMSAKPSADAQTSPRWVSRCKGTTKFADLQIFSGKSFRSFKSFKDSKVILV